MLGKTHFVSKHSLQKDQFRSCGHRAHVHHSAHHMCGGNKLPDVAARLTAEGAARDGTIKTWIETPRRGRRCSRYGYPVLWQGALLLRSSAMVPSVAAVFSSSRGHRCWSMWGATTTQKSPLCRARGGNKSRPADLCRTQLLTILPGHSAPAKPDRFQPRKLHRWCPPCLSGVEDTHIFCFSESSPSQLLGESFLCPVASSQEQ